MDPQSIDRIFWDAAQLASPAERQAYLDQACAGDVRLRQKVEKLLELREAADEFLESPPPALCQTLDQPTVSEGPGTVIGPYKLLEQIGEGGFGVVFMAEQTQPVRRKVALKVLKPGMDTRLVITRFEAERQALALMDHPNIAKVHDGGATSSGRPYFVMELVKGIPITKYCDEHHLTPRQRLELFVPICHAIQHAHQKGVIHRDLKPSNVLVALYDDKPVPKVIDFGVAKATGQLLTEQTLHTGFGAVVGTPEYMSPEQASFNNLDIDTRSDVYSLGVLLYELLAGSPPFSKKELEKVSVMEMLRVIREQEPSKPSNKLSTAEGLPTLAANRGTEPAQLTKLVRGELDWIVMKALEKDRSRRYETANGFAMDVQRYLADEPVQACPPSTGYRLRKFARRNKGPMLAALTIFLLLVSGIAGTTVGLLAARKQREDAEREANRAITAEKLASNRLAQVEAEKQRADEEHAIARVVDDFVQKDLLGQVDPFKQPGAEGPRDPDIKVRTVLDRAAKTIAARFAKQPRVEAAIRLTLANAYWSLGNYQEARLHAERSVELRSAHLGADHADTLSSKSFLGMMLYHQLEFKRAEALLEDVLQRRTRTLGPDNPDTLQSMQFLAFAYQMDGSADGPDRAEVLLKEVVKKRTNLLGPDHKDTLGSKVGLVGVYKQQGKLDQAEAMYVELLPVFERKFGPDYAFTILIRNNLGLVYLAQGKTDQAEPHIRSVLERHIKLHGEDHPRTLAGKSFLARLYRAQRKYDEAAKLYEVILAKQKDKDGFNVNTLFLLGELVGTLLEAKQLDKALPLVGELVKGHEQLSALRLNLAFQLEGIGLLLVKHEQYLEAEKLLRRSLAIREKMLSDDWSTFNTQSMLGAALLGKKEYAKAEPLLLKGYEGMKQRADKIPAPDRFRLIEALERLVQFYDAWGKPDEAATWRKELEKTKEKR